VIRSAEAADLDIARELLREYAAWVGGEICFSSFEKELADLPGRYAPPDGRLLLAVSDDGSPSGCVALRRFSDDAAEVKRLYVRPAFRGSGLGRALIERIITEARAEGYVRLLLDTLPRMGDATRLYGAYGFQAIPRYGDNPAEALCFALNL
jgi:carbonic anhydrase